MRIVLLDLQFSVVLKHTRPGMHHDNIMFQIYIQNKSLVHRKSSMRGQEAQLFISTQPLFKGEARAAISIWVNKLLIRQELM